MKEATAADLLALARALLDDDAGAIAPAPARAASSALRTRAAALLTRQALETAVDAFWRQRGVPLLERCPMRAQLVCLRAYLAPEDATLAAQLDQAWGQLSDACHHRPYELPPTVTLLRPILQIVEQAIRQVPPGGAQRP